MVLIWNEFHDRHFHYTVRQTLINWGTDKNTEKLAFPFTDQIPCGYKPFCQQSLTQTFFWDTGEESRRKGPNFKRMKNAVLPKLLLRKLFFLYRQKTYYNKW